MNYTKTSLSSLVCWQLFHFLDASSSATLANQSFAFWTEVFELQQIFDVEWNQAAATNPSCCNQEEARHPGTRSFLFLHSGQNSFFTRGAGDLDRLIIVKVDKLNWELGLAHDGGIFFQNKISSNFSDVPWQRAVEVIMKLCGLADFDIDNFFPI